MSKACARRRAASGADCADSVTNRVLGESAGFLQPQRGEPPQQLRRPEEKENPVADELERVSMDEIEAEDATPLPNKEVMSLLDVNANVDLGLDLAAPVDLAAAAN